LEGNGDGGPEVAGELNYMISRLLKNYWDSHHNYQGINDIVGALEGARMEFYRRIAVPYENQKIFENGDVY
jgi:hypothetical protein